MDDTESLTRSKIALACVKRFDAFQSRLISYILERVETMSMEDNSTKWLV